MRQVNKRVERVVRIKASRFLAVAEGVRKRKGRLLPSKPALAYRGG